MAFIATFAKLMKYEYQPGDSYSMHVTEKISCTFCEIVSTKISVSTMRKKGTKTVHEYSVSSLD